MICSVSAVIRCPDPPRVPGVLVPLDGIEFNCIELGDLLEKIEYLI